MMADRIHLRIVTPSGTALEANAEYIRIPTPEGSVGILADHAPILCAVGEGKLKCRSEEGETIIAVSGGVASVERNEVIVLTEKAEMAE